MGELKLEVRENVIEILECVWESVLGGTEPVQLMADTLEYEVDICRVEEGLRKIEAYREELWYMELFKGTEEQRESNTNELRIVFMEELNEGIARYYGKDTGRRVARVGDGMCILEEV